MNKWTPCKKHLPPKNGMYLCTISDGSGDPYVEMRRYTKKENAQKWSNGDFITAWMPLPSPYKED